MDKEHIHEHDNPEEAVKAMENEAIEALASDAEVEKPELDSIDALAAQLVDHVDVPDVSDIKPEDAVEEVAEVVAEEASEETSAAEETVEETVEEASETVEEAAEEDSKEEESSSEKETEDEEVDETEEDNAEEEDEDDEGAAGKSVTKKADKHKEKDKEESAKERSLLYTIFDTVRYIAIGLLVGILLVVFVIQRNDVYGSSMEPTLHSGDAVFVEMISVYTGNFSRGDIVTIDAKGMEGYSHEENLIKRIVGLPGETIKIEDGNVYINGVLLDESEYLPAGTKTYVGAEGQARGYQEVTLGPDEYYCMGDNRGGSNDSRRMGPFKKKQIEAKVLMRIYPFNKMKFY